MVAAKSVGGTLVHHIWLRLGKELPDDEIAAFARAYPEARFVVGDTPAGREAIEAVFTNRPLPEEVTEQLSALRWIHTTFGGGTPFLTPTVAKRGITVTTSRGVQAGPLAEFTEACVLALAKKIPVLARHKMERRWAETLRPDTLANQTVVLLGLGAINSLVARRLYERGMKVQAIRRDLTNVPPYIDRVCGWDKLHHLLAAADFLIVGLPELAQFRGRLGESELRSMKSTSYVINLVTRGIISDRILERALDAGWIAGAACNVFEENPLPPDSPLWDAPNLIISPNIAQGDPQRWPKLREIFLENVQRYLSGSPLMNVFSDAGGH